MRKDDPEHREDADDIQRRSFLKLMGGAVGGVLANCQLPMRARRFSC
jgi:hypothetical protein